MKRIAVILPILASSSVYALEPSLYIVNGSPADINDYPSFSSLYYDNGKFYGNYCGSTMINNDYVLTAAHCIYGDYDSMLHTWVVPQVNDEDGYLQGQYNTVRAVEFYYPDDYQDSEQAAWPNDIAIIKVAQSLGKGDFFSTLNATEDNVYAELNSSQSFMAIGHGLIEGNVDSDGILQQTNLVLLTSANCGTSDTQLCFDGTLNSGYKNSTCNGDSGGPVFASLGAGLGYKQIGITSYGPKDCGDPQYNLTSVFTEIYDYNNWISSVIQGGETPKYHVVTQGNTRQLVENATSEVKASTSQSGGGSGGSLGMLSIFVLGLLSIRRKLMF